MRKLAVLLTMLSIMAVLVVPASGQEGDELPSIAGVVVDAANNDDAPQFTVLLAAVQAAGLVDVLDQTGPYTVFAPTDEAFGALLNDLGISAEDLLNDTELLTSVLLYHVVPGTFDAETVATLDGATVATTYWGSTIDISITDDGVFVDNSQVINTDIAASNGIIHVIDSVILPSEAEGNLRGLESNAEQSIAEIAVALSTDETSPEFQLLVAAATEAGFVEALTNGGPYTVFAPTDAAFTNLLNDLGIGATDLLNDTELLTTVLSYHVVPFALYAEDVIALDGSYVGTLLDGNALMIEITDEGAFVNSSQIISTDVEASNGIIHVIDTVLVPAMN